MSDFQPILPYAGTSGWSGSETSRERAVELDRSGRTAKRQKDTLRHVLYSTKEGITWKELSDLTGWHHGTASGVLSVLHKAGKIERLRLTRNKCAIYVHPDYVLGRPIAVRKIRKCSHCGHVL